MPHDKIKAAARRRMAETGESYAAARRAVIAEHQRDTPDVPCAPETGIVQIRRRDPAEAAERIRAGYREHGIPDDIAEAMIEETLRDDRPR